MLQATIPVWMSEVVPPRNRGALVDLHGASYLLGFSIAAWVGYGFYFLSDRTDAAWRIPYGAFLNNPYPLRQDISDPRRFKH
jgi:hypothetical protein